MLGEPSNEPTRKCTKCGQTKPFNTIAWTVVQGKPRGNVCKPCAAIRGKAARADRKKMYIAARTLGIATLDPTAKPPKTEVSRARSALPGELPPSKLHIAKALRSGAAVLNEIAPDVMTALTMYVETPTHPHHEWALKLVAERILPLKMFTEMGLREAGIDPGRGKGGPGGAGFTANITISLAEPGAVREVQAAVHAVEAEVLSVHQGDDLASIL